MSDVGGIRRRGVGARLALWASALAVVAGLLAWYAWELRRAAAAGRPVRRPAGSARPGGPDPDAPRAPLEIVVELGPGTDPVSLSPRELALINAAAREWRRAGPGARVLVATRARRRGLLAKIVLHSHGLGPGAMEITLPRAAAPPGVRVIRPVAAELKQLAAPGTVLGAAIVPGNEPLDESTPTVDLVARTLKAVDYWSRQPGCVLVLTGGRTAGAISEARMMAIIAASRGVPREAMLLEVEASSTRENAVNTARIFKGAKLRKVTVITKASHLPAALAAFRRESVFKDAEGLASDVTDEEVIAQMRAYLEVFDSPRVRARLEALEAGRHGVD
jgi:hypothetical protein